MTAADSEELKRLLTVQEHDRALDALRHRRQTLPELEELVKIASEAEILAATRAEIAERRHAIERDQKRLEDEVALLEDRVVSEDGKLYGGEVAGVKELQALQDEIQGLKERQRLVEDQILEVMEAAEPVDAELDANAAQHAELEARRDAAQQRLAESEGEIDGEAADVDRQRTDAANGIGAELLAEYDRIRATPGRVGVARLVGTTCHGCHLELAAVEVDRLKKLPADALVHCDECGCILVR